MKVITDCNKCIFSKEYQETNGNTSFVLVCNYEKVYIDKVRKEPFLLIQSSNKIKGYGSIDIPNNCPLENYKK